MLVNALANLVSQGDRVGICVTQFDPKQLERGLVCKPGILPTISAAIIQVTKISYFKGAVSTKSKFHVTIGHETVMGRVSFFGLYLDEQKAMLVTGGPPSVNGAFDFSLDYRYQEELLAPSVPKKANSADDEAAGRYPAVQFALVEFERPVTCTRNALVIGSRLDADIHANTCRLAFHGRLSEALTDQNYAETVLPAVKVYKEKSREGVVERKVDDYSLVCRGLFKKETNLDAFVGLRVRLSTGEMGSIEGGFGQSGKFKVRIPGIRNFHCTRMCGSVLTVKWNNDICLVCLQNAQCSNLGHVKRPFCEGHFPISLSVN